MSLLGPLFRGDAMEGFFSDRARVQGMLDFEAALARAEARVGVIPVPAAEVIAGRCVADLYDGEALARAGARAGNLAIPLVQELTARVEEVDPEAAGYVHWAEIKEVLLHMAIYCGVPAANSAFHIAAEVFAEKGPRRSHEPV